MEQIISTNQNTRTSRGSVDTLYVLDRQQTSFVNLFQVAKEFVQSKDSEGKWRDFWAGSVGTTLMQLMAGFAEYNAYNAITARREAYLFEAKQRSSAIAIASTLGYPVFRGQNLHILVTFIPSSTREIKKFDIVGSMGQYDLVALEEKVVTYGQKSELLVAVGKLMEDALTIPSAKTHWFRFYADKVSEDIMLFLNDVEVPHSREILAVLDDEFSVISNSVGGVDVLYINRYPPAAWSPMTKYTFYDYILPDYHWRSSHMYEVGDVVTSITDDSLLPVFYTCTKAGVSGSLEPSWPEHNGEKVIAGENEWVNSGRKESPIFFKCVSPGLAVSGNSEPNWPNMVGAIVKEGDIEWACVNTYSQSKYSYDTGDILKLMYIECEQISFDSSSLSISIGDPQVYTVENKYQEPETISRIQETAPLYHETQHVIRGREDYRKLLKSTIPGIADTNSHDKSPAVVEVTYVKDHTTTTWTPSMYVDVGDEILPSYQNGFIYRALNSGYVGSNQYGKSDKYEPTWSPMLDTMTEDGQLVWRTMEFNPVANADIWKPGFTYRVGDYCLPRNESEHPNLMFRVDRVNSEPDWPVFIGNKVMDNEVQWECVDTIKLNGYEASYYQTNKAYKVGDLVQPVISNGYFYIAKTEGKSGDKEPDWPLNICSTVIDNQIVWECYDLLDSSYYQKNVAQEKLETYRPFGVQPPIITDPELVHVGLGVYIDLKRGVDEGKVLSDVKQILNRYQKILALDITIVDIENALEEELDYVRIARVYCLENSKVKSWRPGMLCVTGDVVMPSNRAPAPGFSGLPSAKATDYTKTWAGIEDAGYTDLLYSAKIVSSVLQGKTSGYTAFPDRGISGAKEPIWPDAAGESIQEGCLVWTMKPRRDFANIPDIWLPNTTYFKGAGAVPTNIIMPTLLPEVTDIIYKEPDWPDKANKVVQDNEVYWVSFSPQERVLPLAWNEYYIFRVELKVTLKGEDLT